MTALREVRPRWRRRGWIVGGNTVTHKVDWAVTLAWVGTDLQT